MAEDSNDHPSDAQNPTLGAGKDVMFGWLVGRAAADLGLAQAIVASEAQRNDQLKRLEASLLSQVQDLFKQQSSGLAVMPAGIDELKAELLKFTDRMGSLETAAQQTQQWGDAIKAEIAAVEKRIGEQQNRFETGSTTLEQIESGLSARVRELEQQVGGAANASHGLSGELGELRSQLQSLVDRLGGCEQATSTALTRAELEAERWRWTAEVDEQVRTRIREFGDEIREKLKSVGALKQDQESGTAELTRLAERLAQLESETRQSAGELKAELAAHREASRSREGERKTSEKVYREQLDRLEPKLVAVESAMHEQWERVAASQEQIFAALTSRLETLAQRLSEADSARGADEIRWKKTIEDEAGARFNALEAALNEQRRLGANHAADDSSLKLDLHALSERMAKMEFAVQQTQAISSAESQRSEQLDSALKSEIAAFKADIAEKLGRTNTSVAASAAFEERFARKLDDLHAQLAKSRQEREGHDRRFDELTRELQNLLRRLSEVEAGAHQTHALMINESEQNAQLRHGLTKEHEALRAQLSAGQAQQNAVHDLGENFRRHLFELENRLSKRLGALELRAAEMREPPAHFHAADQIAGRVEVVPTVEPFPVAVAVPVDIRALKEQRDASFASADALTPPRSAESAAEPLQRDSLGNVNRDQLKQLQERISADIERARNELREKSGRWKVRR